MIERSFYQSPAKAFLNDSVESILGRLATRNTFSLETGQRNAWREQIEHLKAQLTEFPEAEIFFEFAIPRMGKRVDVILLLNGVIFVIEYKTGAGDHSIGAADQVVDYALDLKNFHEGSHDRWIVPILISRSIKLSPQALIWSEDHVAELLKTDGTDLAALIGRTVREIEKLPSRPIEIPSRDWAESGYKPTPTIVEAAQALYSGHSVEDISRSDAGKENLTLTANCISEIIARSRLNGRKSICFVTGVPGAGKTLAGLNISTQKDEGNEEHAVFLSGNGPLVSVLREALARDEVYREKVSKKSAHQKVSSFIQNIHHFRDESLRSLKPPIEHVVVFDEAQRAWNLEAARSFMVRKRDQANFDMSEPEFLISVMDRRTDWATIVCLIGGGQEINTGEAGLTEWFDSLQRRFPNWDVYHSGQLTDPNYSWGQDLSAKLVQLRTEERKGLHLAVPIRSFRAERLSDFVESLINGDATRALAIHSELSNYPIALTRNLETARQWLWARARGSERTGLVASSGALRLRPSGIQVKAKIDPPVWFLNDKDDVRSSHYLEEVATEFDIQGLELDWTGVCWDGDFRMQPTGWGHYSFKGTRWQNVNNHSRKVYLANAYRVLLTRARQGMIIFIPEGDPNDGTRPPAYYDHTYEFLKSCGIQEVETSA
jgi:hypothetical protein